MNKEWQLVNFCEFDKYATKSYCAVHNVDERLNAENAKTNTIVRKVTPEEIKMYEEQLNKTDCHRLILKK